LHRIAFAFRSLLSSTLLCEEIQSKEFAEGAEPKEPKESVEGAEDNFEL
jgi:hypothetical protein